MLLLPLKPSKAAQIIEHVPHTGNSLGESHCSGCSGPIRRPSFTSATQEQEGLGLACVCSLVDGSNSENPEDLSYAGLPVEFLSPLGPGIFPAILL